MDDDGSKQQEGPNTAALELLSSLAILGQQESAVSSKKEVGKPSHSLHAMQAYHR